jgi:uncharacterized protein (TIGR02391 family)
MATRRAAQPHQANLTTDQMRAAIPKLLRRIADLEAFDPATIKDRSDPSIEALDKKLEGTIADIFGTGTTEYIRYRPNELDSASYYMGGTPHHEVIAGLVQGREREITNLRTIIETFEEKLAEGGDDAVGRARRELDLHPEIARASAQLFEDGHYANAVEDACKVLEVLVKVRTTRTDPGGTELMQLVFSPKAPILKYNEQQTESEKSQQQGMMYLFAGAMLAIRNPRAHGLVNDHPARAVEYLSFLSMLAKSLDNTTRA